MVTNDGQISMHHVKQLTVHSLYEDRYAFRENLTEIVVQNLSANQKIRI